MSDDDLRTVDNTQRGCGHLKNNQSYLRSSLSKLGTLPAFVELTQPIEWLEGHLRGWQRFPGEKFELSVTPPGGAVYAALREEWDREHDDPSSIDYPFDGAGMDLMKSVTAVRDVDREYLSPDYLGHLSASDIDPDARTLTDPLMEGHRHMKRLEKHTSDSADHVGGMRTAHAHDILMWVGESYYPEPADFINECKQLGLNKAIPTSKNQAPPIIKPGRSRVWCIHPNAVPAGHDDDGEALYQPGIIGYAYVSEVIHTETEDGRFPQYVEEWAESDVHAVERVEIGPEVSEEEAENESLTDGGWTEEDG